VYVKTTEETGNYNQKSVLCPDSQLKVIKTTATCEVMLNLNI